MASYSTIGNDESRIMVNGATPLLIANGLSKLANKLIVLNYVMFSGLPSLVALGCVGVSVIKLTITQLAATTYYVR